MQENPFEDITTRLNRIEETLHRIESKSQKPERKESDVLHMNVEQTAKYLNLAKQTVYGLSHRHEIPCMKRGNRLYFDKAELNNWLKEGKKKTNDEITAELDEYLSRKGGKK